MKDRLESLIGQITNWQIEFQGRESDLGLEPDEVLETSSRLLAVLKGLQDGDEQITVVLSSGTMRLYPDIPLKEVEKMGKNLREIIYSHTIPEGGMHN